MLYTCTKLFQLGVHKVEPLLSEFTYNCHLLPPLPLLYVYTHAQYIQIDQT